MNFFKHDDFYPHVIPNTSFLEPIEFRTTLAELCNAKIEREGKVVYGWEHSTYWRPCKTDSDAPSKQALLINIEPVEKCTHPEEKVNFFYVLNEPQHYKCECGAKLKPKTFEEIK